MTGKSTDRPADGRSTIDWDALRKRMALAQDELERSFAPSQEQESALLKTRAVALARAAPRELEGEFIDVVEFTMAHERYGVDTKYVREVCRLTQFTSVPCTPAFVLGIVSIRGQVLSLLDLKKFFGLPDKGLADLNRIIVLHSGDIEFGILADALPGVRRIPIVELQSDFATLTGLRKEYLKGVASDGAIVLDALAILSDPGIIVQDREAG